MNLHDLLAEAVADVEPDHALDDIRARTTRSGRRWPYAPAGAVLAIAASVTAFAVLGPDNAPTASDPGASTPPTPTPTVSEPAGPQTKAGAVYYIGETPDGLRLYREFAPVPTADPLVGALTLLFDSEPQDPDYRNGWPPLDSTFVGAEVVGDVIRVEIDDPELLLEHDPDTEQNALAIEQVIYTAQAAVQERLSVQFVHDGNPISEVLGQPSSEPLANGPILATLAHVSLTSPTEGMLVDNDEPLVVEGVGNSFEGNIVTWVEDLSGAVVVEGQPTIAGTYEDKLFPYTIALDLTGVPPGDYLVVSSTDDPSGQGREHTDSRRVTVVE